MLASLPWCGAVAKFAKADDFQMQTHLSSRADSKQVSCLEVLQDTPTLFKSGCKAVTCLPNCNLKPHLQGRYKLREHSLQL